MASFELNTIGFVQKWLCAKGLVKSIPGVIHTGRKLDRYLSKTGYKIFVTNL